MRTSVSVFSALLRRNKAASSGGLWPMGLPLIRFSERKEDIWTLQDAVTGALVTGETGAGKSSGPANLIAGKFLSAGFGGIVLCYKSEESDIWVKRLKRANREADIRVFGIGSPYRYNFLDFESKTKASGLDQIDNLVSLLRDIASVRRTVPLGNDASYWIPMQKLLIRNSLSLLILAGEPITLKAINELIQSSPGSVPETGDKTWQKRSYMYATLEKAEHRHGAHPEFAPVEQFWMYTRAKLPDKTRATIDSEFMGLADGPLSRGKLSELFSEGTNIDPTECFDGKVIIVDVPVEEFLEAGQYAALIWATAFMRATMRRSYKSPTGRPVFLFADEAQAFSTEKDAEYHAACRSKGVCVVRMTQNIPGWVKSYGGGQLAQITVDSILGNLCTKILLQNSDPVTNSWATKMIAKDLEYKHSLSNSGSMSSSNGFNSSASVSESFEHACREEEFMNLKNGGPKNDFIVEGIIFESGRHWLGNRRWCIRRFKQR